MPQLFSAPPPLLKWCFCHYDRYENSDAETESSGNSDNEEEMEEDKSEIASADEMEVNNETLDDCIDSFSTTVGPSFTATPGTKIP